jgi:hypothetical protein
MTGMKRIEFYKSANGASPVEEFLETLDDSQAKKVLWVLRLLHITLVESRKRDYLSRR